MFNANGDCGKEGDRLLTLMFTYRLLHFIDMIFYYQKRVSRSWYYGEGQRDWCAQPPHFLNLRKRGERP